MEKSPLEKLREMQNVSSQELRGKAPEESSKKTTIISIIIFGGIFLFTKFKYLSILLKFIPTVITMGIALYAYSIFFGWKFALGLLLLILLHESGHGFTAKIMGIKVGVPIFIPFLGAFISLKEQLKSTYVEAIVGFGGPFAGLIGAVAVFCFGYYNPDPHIRDFCIALAWFTGMINYFNMMPFFGLDGDRISQPMNKYHWVVLIVVVSALIYWYHEKTNSMHPFMIFLIIGALIKGYRVWNKDKAPKTESLLEKLKSSNAYPDEESISDFQRLQSLLAFIFLTTALTALMIYTEILRMKPPESN